MQEQQAAPLLIFGGIFVNTKAATNPIHLRMVHNKVPKLLIPSIRKKNNPMKKLAGSVLIL
jgi:hypothetical protein